MPGYEPFMLCDFHVHTSWSDGRLSLREVVDLYGQTERFDVIAITDHILMKGDLLKRAGRIASLGLKNFSVTEEQFPAYLFERFVGRGRSALLAIRTIARPGASRFRRATCGTTARRWRRWSMCGKRPIGTISSQ